MNLFVFSMSPVPVWVNKFDLKFFRSHRPHVKIQNTANLNQSSDLSAIC